MISYSLFVNYWIRWNISLWKKNLLTSGWVLNYSDSNSYLDNIVIIFHNLYLYNSLIIKFKKKQILNFKFK